LSFAVEGLLSSANGPEAAKRFSKSLKRAFKIVSEWRFAGGRTRIRRREPEEEPRTLEEIAASPEEVELSDFLEGLGPQGISEVSLYRILPSGKQRFITSGWSILNLEITLMVEQIHAGETV
jgi:hypothetical protein